MIQKNYSLSFPQHRLCSPIYSLSLRQHRLCSRIYSLSLRQHRLCSRIYSLSLRQHRLWSRIYSLSFPKVYAMHGDVFQNHRRCNRFTCNDLRNYVLCGTTYTDRNADDTDNADFRGFLPPQSCFQLDEAKGIIFSHFFIQKSKNEVF